MMLLNGTTSISLRMPLLDKLSGEELATPVDFIGLRNDPAVAYLNILIRYSIHHRVPRSTYLQPVGTKVPAIYVESGDEPYPDPVAHGQHKPPVCRKRLGQQIRTEPGAGSSLQIGNQSRPNSSDR